MKLFKLINIEAIVLFDSGSDLSLMRAGVYVKMGAPKLMSQTVKFRSVQPKILP